MTKSTEEKTYQVKCQDTGEIMECTRDQLLEMINTRHHKEWQAYDKEDSWEHALEHWTNWRFVPVHRLRIVQDGSPEEPRWDPITVFATWTRNYAIGDEQLKDKSPDEWLISQLSEAAQDEWERFKEEDLPRCPYGCSYNSREHREWVQETDRMEKSKIMELVEKEFFILPVNAYIHSGITISTGSFSCPWDSGQIGWIILSKERAAKELSPDTDPLEFMRAEIKLYDIYLQGDVWGFVVEQKSGDGDWDEVYSCYGFYGSGLDELKPDMDDHVSSTYKFTDEDWQKAWDDRFN